jgi:RNA recognition motif-containing protein
LKYFYYAFCRFPDIIQARHLLNDIKFPELIGKTCRALPYDKDLLRNCSSGSNIFVKGIPPSWTHKELHDAFKACGSIVSARVSIKDDHSSRGYGFVAFAKKQEADAACEQVSF